MRAARTGSGVSVYTIGHSTRSLEEFLRLLQGHQIDRLVDVRSVPRSRRCPQFNKETLPDALQAAGLGYLHMPGLGGWRRGRADSPNTGWRNASFRGYADYMQTESFAESLAGLLEEAKKSTVAIMCAEAVPWRCHRSLIADALVVHGAAVFHILGTGAPAPHSLTTWAHVEGKRIIYPLPSDAQGKLEV